MYDHVREKGFDDYHLLLLRKKALRTQDLFNTGLFR